MLFTSVGIKRFISFYNSHVFGKIRRTTFCYPAFSDVKSGFMLAVSRDTLPSI